MTEDKLLNYADGQLLYNDLRERMESKQIPNGGKKNQVLKKRSNKSYDVKWEDVDAGLYDVLINGSSVVRNGIAYIPSANSQTLGLVATGNGDTGIAYNQDKQPYIVTATSSDIKEGTESYKPITSMNQHEAVFYGLAKIAGDETQGISENNAGVYTDEAQTAIKEMFGMYKTLTVTVETYDNVVVTGQTVYVRSENANGEIYATATYDGQPVSFTIPENFSYHISVSDTLKSHYNPTTANGIIKDSDVAVTLYYNSISTAADIKAALNAGTDLTNSVGESITCRKGEDTLTWDIVDYDNQNKRVTLLLHDVFGTEDMVFDPTQTLMYFENGLPSGYYKIMVDGVTQWFKLKESIPAGGQLNINKTRNQYFTFSNQFGNSFLEFGETKYVSGYTYTDLNESGIGVINNYNRSDHGSSNFAESYIFQWLNSNVEANTYGMPITKFCHMYQPYTTPGFINGLDQDFLNCIDETEWLCSTSSVYECPESLGGRTKGINQRYTVRGKFGLPSLTEICGIDGNNPDGSSVFDLYKNADDKARRKYRNNSSKPWFLRSAANEYAVRYIGESGYYDASKAANVAIGVVPACKISADRFSSSETYTDLLFYGLAKIAGDHTQDFSLNNVGIYTDEAKAAIKNMLGVTHTLTVTVLTKDNVTVTDQTVYVRANDADGEIYATAAYDGQPVSFSIPDGFRYHVSVSDTLDHHFDPTTASGIVNNTDVAATLVYSDFSAIRTASDIKAALDINMDLTNLVGESITCTKGSDTLTWDVVDYDATNKKVMLLLHDAFGTTNMVFEPAQALMWCENGLAAGSYTFTDGTTHYYLTLTTAIPAGGQLRAIPTSFWTYASQDATVELESGTVSTTSITGATDLGTCGQGLLNHMQRAKYGSNNYAESAIFWWLNSDAEANTMRVPVTKFSRAYSYASAGFMNGLDANFVNCIDEIDWQCSTSNVYECPESLGGYTKGIKQTYTVKAKFGLASEMEIFGSYGGNPDGSKVFALYSEANSDERKKYRGTSVQVWWLRSPDWYYSAYERFVSSFGDTGSNWTYNSYAIAPACQISASDS